MTVIITMIDYRARSQKRDLIISRRYHDITQQERQRNASTMEKRTDGAIIVSAHFIDFSLHFSFSFTSSLLNPSLPFPVMIISYLKYVATENLDPVTFSYFN